MAFFSRKLNPAQQRYPPSDKEALCIQECLHEYRDILYGAEIVIETDHKNLVQRDIKSPRLLHWRLLIEEFAPTLVYIKGEDNVFADQLSHLPLTVPEENPDPVQQVMESLLYYPDEIDAFPLGFDTIREAQQADPVIMALQQQGVYESQVFHGVELISFVVDGKPKIVLTDELTEQAIVWYHYVMGHVGANRLYSTLKPFFYAHSLKAKIEKYVNTCDSCQHNKNVGTMK